MTVVFLGALWISMLCGQGNFVSFLHFGNFDSCDILGSFVVGLLYFRELCSW